MCSQSKWAVASVLALSSVFADTINVLSSWPNSVPFFVNHAKDGMNKLSQISSTNYKWHQPKELDGYAGSIDNVSKGLVPMLFTFPGYHQNVMGVEHVVFNGYPFSPSFAEFIAISRNPKVQERLDQGFKDKGYDVHAIWPCGAFPGETFWSNKNLNTAEDLDSLKIRTWSLSADVFSKFGAQTMAIPGSKIAAAVKQQGLDAIEFNTPVVDHAMGFSKLFKYNYVPGWHQPINMFYLLVNGPLWRSMSPAQQNALEMTCQSVSLGMYADLLASSQKAQTEYAQKHGVEIKKWPQAIVDQAKKHWAEIADKHSKENKNFAENYQLVESLRPVDGYR